MTYISGLKHAALEYALFGVVTDLSRIRLGLFPKKLWTWNVLASWA